MIFFNNFSFAILVTIQYELCLLKKKILFICEERESEKEHVQGRAIGMNYAFYRDR